MGQTNFFINFTEFELDFTRKILFSLLILPFVHWVKFEWRIKIEQKSLFRLHVSSYPPFKYIYVYTHIHIYNETKSIEPRNYTMAMILHVRCAFKCTYTSHHTTHTHTHTPHSDNSGNFLICIVIFFLSLSSACSLIAQRTATFYFLLNLQIPLPSPFTRYFTRLLLLTANQYQILYSARQCSGDNGPWDNNNSAAKEGKKFRESSIDSLDAIIVLARGIDDPFLHSFLSFFLLFLL